ncbi:MAG: hypothetical protein WC584_03275 [Candidatus Pacearchaeota archaeon]
MVEEVKNLRVKKIASGGGSTIGLSDIINEGVVHGKVNLYCTYCGSDTSEEIDNLPTRGEIQIGCITCGRTYEREYGIKKGLEVVYLSDVRMVLPE